MSGPHLQPFASLSQTARDLKSGALSALELTQRMLHRIHTLDSQTHAFARILDNSALEQAAKLDRLREEGVPLGPLHGVPIAIKDLLFTKDTPTASGTSVMAGFSPDYDATVVTRLRAAGAILIAKTQLTEGAFGNHHPSIQAPINPWQAAAWSGVSSSGSGVAVASGLCFGALGSDTGGSIPFPAACCGIVGLKPTYGRVSLHGAFPLASSLDHIGPMTRTVEDAARMLTAIAGYDPQDETSLNVPVPNYVAELWNTKDLDGVRIGVDFSYVSDGVDPQVVTWIEEAMKILQSLGAAIVPMQMPASARTLADGWPQTCARECADAHRHLYPARREEYGPELAFLIERGLSVSASDYEALEAQRVTFRQALDQILLGLDAIIAPGMTMTTPTAQRMTQAVESSEEGANFLIFTAPFDYSGHPTLSLPFARDSIGLPGSIQLIGARLQESRLLQLGAAFEAATPTIDYPGIGMA